MIWKELKGQKSLKSRRVAEAAMIVAMVVATLIFLIALTASIVPTYAQSTTYTLNPFTNQLDIVTIQGSSSNSTFAVAVPSPATTWTVLGSSYALTTCPQIPDYVWIWDSSLTVPTVIEPNLITCNPTTRDLTITFLGTSALTGTVVLSNGPSQVGIVTMTGATTATLTHNQGTFVFVKCFDDVGAGIQPGTLTAVLPANNIVNITFSTPVTGYCVALR